jgi:hypothetical protein
MVFPQALEKSGLSPLFPLSLKLLFQTLKFWNSLLFFAFFLQPLKQKSPPIRIAGGGYYVKDCNVGSLGNHPAGFVRRLFLLH